MILALMVAGYVLVPVAGITLVLVARARPDVIAPLGVLLGNVFAHRAARIALLLFVWWLGWHFLVPD
ncbi:hypothetical protein JOF48_003515 [Arthrobacter stackebrandtii]|uniref:DUF4190 domain-containing protein n=1 Tax=Arthrobacter stackebrandtii TaxID=272161 RepID=A0ABS4Z0X8_9MICC|nr:DUF6186 family protein [Arthrobacter stackebrandtii]MBP2414716.1 hypothetical protein [Arthrobacter stackebrandtii]PYH01801.1 hypothetical protein CVV67_04955 [Arthrobacter stackebrandtii]